MAAPIAAVALQRDSLENNLNIVEQQSEYMTKIAECQRLALVHFAAAREATGAARQAALALASFYRTLAIRSRSVAA